MPKLLDLDVYGDRQLLQCETQSATAADKLPAYVLFNRSVHCGPPAGQGLKRRWLCARTLLTDRGDFMADPAPSCGRCRLAGERVALPNVAESLRQATDLCDRAIAQDPDYALALAWACGCRADMLGLSSSDNPEEDIQIALDQRTRALHADGNDPGVLTLAALAGMARGVDKEASAAMDLGRVAERRRCSRVCRRSIRSQLS